MAYNIYTNLFYRQTVTSAKSLDEPQKTTDRETIRTWVEARGGKPAVQAMDAQQEVPGLYIHFPEDTPATGTGQEISWEQFFTEFERHKFVLVYREQQEEGDKSRFYKLMRRKR